MRVLFMTVRPVLTMPEAPDTFPIPAIGSQVVIEDTYYTVKSHVWEYVTVEKRHVPTIAIYLTARFP